MTVDELETQVAQAKQSWATARAEAQFAKDREVDARKQYHGALVAHAEAMAASVLGRTVRRVKFIRPGVILNGTLVISDPRKHRNLRGYSLPGELCVLSSSGRKIERFSTDVFELESREGE